MIIKILKVLAGLIVVLIGVFALGPKRSFEKIDNKPSKKTYDITSLDLKLKNQEQAVQYLKEDNESRVVWADSSKQKTKYSIVYLHGFSASQGEGFPMHVNIADSLKANLYLPRLPEHGVDYKDAMKNLTPAMLIDAAKEAIAIGKTIGEEVILMGCSTGGTLAIYLAAADRDLKGLILLSPNIEVNVAGVSLLTGPWGEDLAHNLIGEHRLPDPSEDYNPYWSQQYHTNGLIAMQGLLDMTMTDEIFGQLDIPLYCGYFYKNEEIQDPVVSVSAMLEFKDALTIEHKPVMFKAFEKGNHVLGSVYKNDNWEEVQNDVLDFINRELL